MEDGRVREDGSSPGRKGVKEAMLIGDPCGVIDMVGMSNIAVGKPRKSLLRNDLRSGTTAFSANCNSSDSLTLAPAVDRDWNGMDRGQVNTRFEGHNDLEVTQDFQKLLQGKDMKIKQESGQRSYGPPTSWTGPPPPKGNEVFVGRLPRHIFEPQLIPLFERIGPIYEFRMMIDFKGLNRGFCFVQFINLVDAEKAVRELNGHEVIPGHKIGVVKSVDNSRLLVRGIPLDKTEEDILGEIDTITDGVAQVTLVHPGSKSDTFGGRNQKNRGFAYIEYVTHKAACLARRKMVSSSIKMWGHHVQVDWAMEGNEFKTLHVQNINPLSTPDSIKRIFSAVCGDGVEYVKVFSKYAFVQFVSRDHAMKAKAELEQKPLDGSMVKINWARPMNKYAHRGSRPTSMEMRSEESERHFQRRNNIAPLISGSFPKIPGKQQDSFGTNCTLVTREGLSTHFSPSTVSERILPEMASTFYSPVPVFSMPQIPLQSTMTSHYSVSQKNPVLNLMNLCYSQGWNAPVFLPLAMRLDDSLYYSCKVVVSHHSIGVREFETPGYYRQMNEAKAAAAEGLLQLLAFPLMMRPMLMTHDQYLMGVTPGLRETPASPRSFQFSGVPRGR